MSLLFDSPVPAAPRLDGRTVVVVHAHPDDEAIFTGATIRRLADHGARVVLVTATAGELGTPRYPLHGRSIGDVRRAELERSAELLGVARLVLLGRRDSGLPGWESGQHPQALVRADLPAVARTLAALVEAEQAEAVIGYDADGIYGHPDHVAVHRVGARAARLAGITGYGATVDREYLHFTGPHLVEGDAPRRHRPTAGLSSAEITTAVEATESALTVKRSAMAAHYSQISAARLDGPEFAGTYGVEWYVRDGRPGVLEALGNAHLTAVA
jgi:N-acetyl-1-D-myo-inositol-2-amino-2-deoxy-alpha-D-glucopyranoside deacetylase